MTTTDTALIIDGDKIPVIPDTRHEYILSTGEVARGYGVSVSVIRKHKSRHSVELVEGKHFFHGTISPAKTGSGSQTPETMWTKHGVVRLGFFIKSSRATKFRDAAEDLILSNKSASFSPATQKAMALLERHQLECAAKAFELVKPTSEFGSPSPKTGAPRIRLVRAHWSCRWATNEVSRSLRALNEQQREFTDMLAELDAESAALSARQ